MLRAQQGPAGAARSQKAGYSSLPRKKEIFFPLFFFSNRFFFLAKPLDLGQGALRELCTLLPCLCSSPSALPVPSDPWVRSLNTHPPWGNPWVAFSWTLEAGSSAGNGNRQAAELKARLRRWQRPCVGIIGADRKLRDEVPKCPWMSPDGLSLTQKHPVRVLSPSGGCTASTRRQHRARGCGFHSQITSGKLEKICKYP